MNHKPGKRLRQAALALLALGHGLLAAQTLKDQPYGEHPRQRLDVHAPAAVPQGGRGAPVLFLVHGGAWALGDKGRPEVWQAKAQRWLARGLAVVSVNYRLVPAVSVQDQVADLRLALLQVRRQAAAWGLDRERIVLVGHSAGAHLLALMAAQQPLDHGADPLPWLGSVLLDSAALDVPAIMDFPHAPLYDRAFGGSRAGWLAASPLHVLAGPGAPALAVCSSLRTDACPAAQRYVEKARSLGSYASLLAQPLSHADINARLGEDNAYTAQVELFLRGLDSELDRRLQP